MFVKDNNVSGGFGWFLKVYHQVPRRAVFIGIQWLSLFVISFFLSLFSREKSNQKTLSVQSLRVNRPSPARVFAFGFVCRGGRCFAVGQDGHYRFYAVV
jgi:hypothetical protein